MPQANNKKKRVWLRILLPIAGIVVILTAAIVLTSLYVARPTKGAAIAQYENPKSALLVIDVQKDTTGNTSFYGDTGSFIEKVNQAVTYAQESGMEILYIQNITGGNPIIQLLSQGKYRKGTEGAELDDSLQVVNGNVFTKSLGDSFSSSEFEEYLISNEVNSLYLVGADAAGCVYSTAKGGLNRNYGVNIIRDAIITINGNTMDQILKQYDSDGMVVIDLAQLSGIR